MASIKGDALKLLLFQNPLPAFTLPLQRSMLMPHDLPPTLQRLLTTVQQPQTPCIESLTHASYSVLGSKLRLVGEIFFFFNIFIGV